MIQAPGFEGMPFFGDLLKMLGTQGVKIPDKSAPLAVANVAAASAERIWRLLKRPGSPPLTRFAVWVSSQECTIDISRAERELGYRPVISREEGFAELSHAQHRALESILGRAFLDHRVVPEQPQGERRHVGRAAL